MRIEFEGTERLARKLLEKSTTDFQEVSEKNIRDIYTRSQRAGGTPVASNELRMSAQYRGDEFGYLKHYAPHVEFGHRLVNGGYVPGQYYLKNNVDTQRPIYKQDLKDKMKE
ncbi:HK97 gp10 family phage protein [Robertmurraya kyonggiensis]|uniref:HK97 gp10 family phage protein n=1 Tax=Robertmurraya kyonggiensis TaxID=1037680 RepID=A0A4V5P0T5_9BACI|nr:HK97 gp10 family phage protein [Robertmurraya kyonggiensis]TKC15680.1 HK97 gp10 family phage protein [Robertmurraya kyonggiensis]